MQLALYRTGGEAILRAVARAGFRTDQIRPSVPLITKLWLLILAMGRGSAHLARSRSRDPGGAPLKTGPSPPEKEAPQ